MGDDLDSPESSDRLYGERGDVPISLPLMQGDVFQGVEIPGFGGKPIGVQVVMHPCSMRAGTKLRERITVAPVTSYQVINDQVWRRHVRVMPLPELDATGRNAAAKFLELTSAPSSSLRLDRRIAALSTRGILLLQQRLIYFMTRLKVGLETLHEQVAPVLIEFELQADWVEAALNANDGHQDEKTVSEAAIAFGSWLDEGDRRQRLQRSTEWAAIRRDARREAARRFVTS
jgi:hypothetical protein